METGPDLNPERQIAPMRAAPQSFLADTGRPRYRDQRSLNAYDQIAQRIQDEIDPETVLDVGCGMGLLVERLRRRRIAAIGIDQDQTVIEQADPKVRPYLFRSDYATALHEGSFDLAVCIETLAEIPPQSAANVIRNICSRTRSILFSLRPAADDAKPAEKVRAPAFWAGLFAENEFFLDSSFDASFITPWAALYRHQPQARVPDLARENDRAVREFWDETRALRVHIDELEESIKRTRLEHESVVKTLTSRLEQWESLWADHEQSMGWKLLHRSRIFLRWMAPPGSRRASLLRVIRDSIVGLMEKGPAAFFRAWRRGIASEEIRIAPGVKTIDQINADMYPDFIARTTPGSEELARQRSLSASWDRRPLISFITPVYKPPLEALRATLESVQAQTYDFWELCIVDASGADEEIRRLLEAFAEKDERIRLKFLDQNLGISENSNKALAMASGEYVALLDHDDVLAPEMLFEVVSRLRENDLADVIYFDEDKLSEDGLHRHDPFFKPDFSPEMLISANYLTHAVYRRSLVISAGRFDPAYDGCQDWDLAFKITELTGHVEHIPKVLYHWRQVSGSTASEFSAKSYVFERQIRCVQEHLRRLGLPQARAYFPRPGFLRAMWRTTEAKVSIVIPTKDKVNYLKRTIESITEQTNSPNYEIILVDNGSISASTLRYYEKLRDNPGIKIVEYKELFNYSKANNLGAEVATGDYLLFLNNDVEILHSDWLQELLRWAERPGIGVVGAKLLYPDDTIQHAGVVIGMEGHASHVFWGYREYQSGPFGAADWYRNYSAVTGACMMMRQETFRETGGFDEKYVLAFSDIELCLRIRERGYRIVFTPFARLRHFEGKSRGDHIPSNDIRVGADDFLPFIKAGDPFYNMNLSYLARKPTIGTISEEDRVSRLLRVAARARVIELTGK